MLKGSVPRDWDEFCVVCTKEQSVDRRTSDGLLTFFTPSIFNSKQTCCFEVNRTGNAEFMSRHAGKCIQSLLEPTKTMVIV